MKILSSIFLLPVLSLCALSQTADIKLTPLMQTEDFGSLSPKESIVFQLSSKSSIELISVTRAFVFGKKDYWELDGSSFKKDIKTGNLIFHLTWKSATNPVPKKLSESIDVIYASKKAKKVTHDITKGKGKINLDGCLLDYDMTKNTQGDGAKINFTSKQAIRLQALQLFSDDNKVIKPSSSFQSTSNSSYNLSMSLGREKAKQVKKVRLVYYPGPYKTVKVPIELTLPLK